LRDRQVKYEATAHDRTVHRTFTTRPRPATWTAYRPPWAWHGG